MADRLRSFFKEEVLTYAYILLYIALSSGQIFFNKICNISCANRCNVCDDALVGKHCLPVYFSCICANVEGYQNCCVCAVPVAVFILGVAAGLEVMSCRMLLIMSVISFGVLVASIGEININWVGVVYQMGGVVGEALRLIFMEIFVKRKGLKLNPISVMYYVSPFSALCLFIPWIFLEKSKLDANGSWNFPIVVLTLNSLCTFALNLSVFLVITHTSALTIRVAGVVKDWVVVLLSALLFADTKLTLINLFGYAIAIAGVAAYNNSKLKKEASRTSSNDSGNAQSLALTTSLDQNR